MVDGFKVGEPGAPNTLQYLVVFPYTTMNTQPKGTRNLITRLAGVNRLDLKTGDTYWPESEVKGERIVVGDIEMECSGTKRGVPERVVVTNYWLAARREVTAMKDCKKDVYSPTHHAYVEFQTTATLIIIIIIKHA